MSLWRWFRRIGVMVIIAVPTGFVPQWWCGREAEPCFHGEPATVLPLARGVARWIKSDVSVNDFSTGSARFDGEWAFGTHQMAALGLLQVAQMFPDQGPELWPLIDRCINRMLDESIRAFDTMAWQEDALQTLNRPTGHAAYLGYSNLVLGLNRLQRGTTRFDALNDRITVALVRRLAASPQHVIETYPGEGYPVDNTAVAASIAIHGRATGRNYRWLLDNWQRTVRKTQIDRASGLLVQAVDPKSGRWIDVPRASGTALAVYFTSFVDRALSADLYRALHRACFHTVIGFGLVNEYPAPVPGGHGDIDSGPVILGTSFSGTGFLLAGSRIHQDLPTYRAVYRLAYLVGAPDDRDAQRQFLTGGPLGNAILLAMLTAGEPGERRHGGMP